MRHYISTFFDTTAQAKAILTSGIKKKERFIHAMLMVLSLSQFALEVSYGVTGIQMLNFCAEILDGLYVGIERRQNRL